MLGLLGFVMLAFGVALRVGARDSSLGYLVTVVCFLLSVGLWVINGVAPLYDNDAMMAGLAAVGLSCVAVGAAAGEVYLLYARRNEI